MTNDIILQAISTKELEDMLRTLVRTEFETMNEELQRIMGEDDLVSTGTACRILGVCSKVLKIRVDQSYFTVYHHLKERRYNRITGANCWTIAISTGSIKKGDEASTFMPFIEEFLITILCPKIRKNLQKST